MIAKAAADPAKIGGQQTLRSNYAAIRSDFS